MRLRTAAVIIILLALPTGFLYRMVLLGRPLARDDASAMVYPVFRAIDRSLAQGELYLWDTHQWSGMPAFARGETTALYPPTIALFAALPWITAAHASYWLHLALGVIGLFWVARNLRAGRGAALVGAASYGFSGYQAAHLVHFNHITALAYVPLTLAVLQTALRRNTGRWWAALAVTVAFAYLSSHPMPFVMTATICLLWLIFGHDWKDQRRPTLSVLLPLLLSLAVAGMLVLPQMLPMLHLAEARGRLETPDPEAALQYVSSFPFRARDLPRVLLPNIYGTVHANVIGGGPAWHESQPFTGAAPLLLALAGAIVAFRRRGWGFCVATFLVGAALMPAEGNPIHALLVHIPLWGGFRAMGRWMVLPIMSMGVFAALALTYLPEAARKRRVAATKVTALLAVLIVMATALLWFTFGVDDSGAMVAPGPWSEPVELRAPADTVFNCVTSSEPLLLVGAALMTALAIGFLAGEPRGGNLRRPGPLLIAALLLAVVLPQWHLWQVTNLTVPREYYTRPPETARAVAPGRITTLPPALVAPEWRAPGETREERTMLERNLLTPALAKVWGVSYADGYSQGLLVAEPLQLWEDYHRYGVQAFAGFGDPSERAVELYGTPVERMKRLHRLAAMRHIVTAGEIDDPDLELTHSGVANVYSYREPHPRYWLAREAIPVRQPEAQRSAIKLRQLDPQRQVVVDREIALEDDSGATDEGVVETVGESPTHLALRVNAPGPRVLVVADAWYPGWRVTVNGEPAEILRANYAFRGVLLPMGEHRVDFDYRPAGWDVAMPMFAVGVIILIALLVWPQREAPREGLAPPED